MSQSKLYSVRFSEHDKAHKNRIWRVLCRSFFQRYVGANDTVLDLGAGFCEFINHIAARRRIAVDISEDVKTHAVAGVEVLLARSDDMRALGDGVVDVVFASNFFEHLATKSDLLRTLSEVRRVLRPGGRLLILQPNIRYAGGAYWDFFDHHLPLTERSLVEALELAALQPVEVRARFLPFSTKSALPQHPALVWLYLRVPLAHRLLGRQSWIVARKPPAPEP
jgi:SAM-dependent methyltransferase